MNSFVLLAADIIIETRECNFTLKFSLTFFFKEGKFFLVPTFQRGNVYHSFTFNCSQKPMGRSRYTIYEDQLPHFLTDTVLNWIPLFIHPGSVQIILDCWSYLQTHHQLKLYGNVILENHLHWIAQAEDLPKEVHRFKAYTAKQLIQYLKANPVDRILHQLHSKKT
ncbi:MAG: hypothetical protein HC877_08485 [Thioploca sp.]|nr:hypothetical protein [Thioploca sp.]